jgi:type VI protein secretion system component Hcp
MAVTFTMTIGGVVTNAIGITSLNFGGDDPQGVLTPADVIITADTSRYSALLLQAFAERTLHKVVIKGFEPNAAGLVHNFVKITLTGAQVISYHIGGTEHVQLTDTLHLSFLSLDYDWLDNNVDFLWQLA